jgi:hypothetical protein
MSELISVLGMGITLSEDGEPFPTVVLDVESRPDVSDLARVHMLDGIGDIETFLEPNDAGVVLRVRLSSPVSAEFAVQLLLPDHAPVLVDAATAGHLLLATTTPSDTGDNPPWLAIDLDGARLCEVAQLPDSND